MSRTRKDSSRNKRRDTEIIRIAEDCFDIRIGGELARSHISKWALNEVLCIGMGYRGPEFEEILIELKSAGHKLIPG